MLLRSCNSSLARVLNRNHSTKPVLQDRPVLLASTRGRAARLSPSAHILSAQRQPGSAVQHLCSTCAGQLIHGSSPSPSPGLTQGSAPLLRTSAAPSRSPGRAPCCRWRPVHAHANTGHAQPSWSVSIAHAQARLDTLGRASGKVS